jgi:hypothetical protein
MEIKNKSKAKKCPEDECLSGNIRRGKYPERYVE